jgi:hypothetical protein
MFDGAAWKATARHQAWRETSVHKHTGLVPLLPAVGIAVLMVSNLAHGQVDGAVQYPPASAGKDAQPPPPAGIVLQSVTPRRIELGISGSSNPPSSYRFRILPWNDNDPGQPPSSFGLSSQPTPSAAEN